MANHFQFPFTNKLSGSTSYKAAYSNIASILVNNNRVFPIQSVYIGPTQRVVKYVGVKTDSQVYLGLNKLFDR